MTTECPEILDDARVICFSPIDERHAPTGATRHSLGFSMIGPAPGLAVCHYDNEPGFYLFTCDDSWAVVADTYHDTVAEALRQAGAEYREIDRTWVWKSEDDQVPVAGDPAGS